MYDQARIVEYGYADHPHLDEIALVATTFLRLGTMDTIIGRPGDWPKAEYFPSDDVLVASELAGRVRLSWNGSEDLVKLFAVVDLILTVYPNLIPWLQGFIRDGDPGEWNFFCLVRHTLHLKFQ